MKGVGGVFAGLLSPLAKFKGRFMKDVSAVGSGIKLLGAGAANFGKTLLGGLKSAGAALMANPMILAVGVIVRSSPEPRI
jgi:hypothetical protein